MKNWKLLFAVGCGLIVAACGGGGGGDSAVTPANFSGTWNGSSSGTAFVFSIVQTGSNFNMTRTSPALAGVAYTGVVAGNSASVTTYINSVSAGTSTLTLSNDTTAIMTVNTCTPPQGYSCAAPGTTLTLTRAVSAIQTFPLDAAYTKAMTTGVNLSGTAIDGADTYTMSISITPAADEVFEGAVSKKAIETLTMKKNGAIVVTDTINNYFTINPMTTKGAIYSDGSYGVLTSNLGSFPTSAKVGDSGSLGTLTLYSNSSKSTVKSTTQSTWTMEADTASTAFGCGNSVLRDAAGTLIGTTAGCYKIDTSGNVLGMRYTVTASGKTLVFN